MKKIIILSLILVILLSINVVAVDVGSCDLANSKSYCHHKGDHQIAKIFYKVQAGTYNGVMMGPSGNLIVKGGSFYWTWGNMGDSDFATSEVTVEQWQWTLTSGCDNLNACTKENFDAKKTFTVAPGGPAVAPPQPSALISAGSNILIVGASHTTQSYGKKLFSLLQADGATVQLYARGGSAPQHWIDGSNDQFFLESPGLHLEGTSSTKISGGIPKDYFKTLRDTIKPNIVIISLGTNVVAYADNSQTQANNFLRDRPREMAKLAVENGAKCYWVGPAKATRTDLKTNLPKAVELIKEGVSQYCTFIDSVPLSDEKDVNNDGVHYNQQGGEKIATGVYNIIKSSSPPSGPISPSSSQKANAPQASAAGKTFTSATFQGTDSEREIDEVWNRISGFVGVHAGEVWYQNTWQPYSTVYGGGAVPGTPTPGPIGTNIADPAIQVDLQSGLFDNAFLNKVELISKELNINPVFLMAVMKAESHFKPDIQNPNSKATGLIQFLPSTATSLGTTVENLVKMTQVQQLDYVKKYYEGGVKRADFRGQDLGDVAMIVFYPVAIGKSDDYVLLSSGKKGYDNNKGLDYNNDGKIVKGEYVEFVKKKASTYNFNLKSLFTGQSSVPPSQPDQSNSQWIAYQKTVSAPQHSKGPSGGESFPGFTLKSVTVDKPNFNGYQPAEKWSLTLEPAQTCLDGSCINQIYPRYRQDVKTGFTIHATVTSGSATGLVNRWKNEFWKTCENGEAIKGCGQQSVSMHYVLDRDGNKYQIAVEKAAFSHSASDSGDIEIPNGQIDHKTIGVEVVNAVNTCGGSLICKTPLELWGSIDNYRPQSDFTGNRPLSKETFNTKKLEVYSDTQMKALIKMTAESMIRQNIPLGNLVRHYDNSKRESGSTHWDPGFNFDWMGFRKSVCQAINQYKGTNEICGEELLACTNCGTVNAVS